MGDYFKPWRRKIGVLTLALACMFMAGWMRGFFVIDQFVFGVRYDQETEITTQHNLTAFGSGLNLSRCTFEHAGGFAPGAWRWWVTPIQEKRRFIRFDIIEDRDTDLHWQFFGIHIASRHGKSQGPKYPDFTKVIVPYWTIVIPLTLLSAYLLLSKTRPAKPKTTVESAAVPNADC